MKKRLSIVNGIKAFLGAPLLNEQLLNKVAAKAVFSTIKLTMNKDKRGTDTVFIPKRPIITQERVIVIANKVSAVASKWYRKDH